MKKIYFLSTCSTCTRILKGLNITEDVILQDIKFEKITDEQLKELKLLAGSYEKLFSRRAIKYKSLGLADKDLSESDYKKLILEEYTFLKRPVFLLDNKVFIGNDKATITLVSEALKN